MGRLRKAVEAAEKRKSIVLGDEDQNGLRQFNEDSDVLLVLSGSDVDLDDLRSAVSSVARVTMANIILNPEIPLGAWIVSTWFEGLVAGYMLSQVPDEPIDDTAWPESD